MATKELKDLQQEFLGIITSLAIESEDEAICKMIGRASEILNDENFKGHINDIINGEMKIVDYVIRCNTQGYGTAEARRINNSALKELETLIRDAEKRKCEGNECEKHGNKTLGELLIDYTGSREGLESTMNRYRGKFLEELMQGYGSICRLRPLSLSLLDLLESTTERSNTQVEPNR